MTNDVADILAILNGYANGNIGFWTYPRGTTGINVSRYLWTGLFDANGTDGTPSKDNAYLRRIAEVLTAGNGASVTNSQAVLSQLQKLSGRLDLVGDDVQKIGPMLQYVSGLVEQGNTYQLDMSTMLYENEYGHGSEWAVHLNDAQLGYLLSALGAVSNSVTIGIGDGFGALGGGTNLAGLAVSLGRLEEYVEQIRDDAETDTLSPDIDAVDVVDDTSDLPATNAVSDLVLPDPDLGDNTAVLDVLDTSAVEGVLPSLTGGDPTLVILGAQGSKGAVPYVEADLSLPPAVQRTMHGVAVWLWRLLFALGVWRIVREEYAYWTTLGGAAVA